MFLKEACYAYQGCIYMVKIRVKTEMHCKNCFVKVVDCWSVLQENTISLSLSTLKCNV